MSVAPSTQIFATHFTRGSFSLMICPLFLQFLATPLFMYTIAQSFATLFLAILLFWSRVCIVQSAHWTLHNLSCSPGIFRTADMTISHTLYVLDNRQHRTSTTFPLKVYYIQLYNTHTRVISFKLFTYIKQA